MNHCSDYAAQFSRFDLLHYNYITELVLSPKSFPLSSTEDQGVMKRKARNAIPHFLPTILLKSM